MRSSRLSSVARGGRLRWPWLRGILAQEPGGTLDSCSADPSPVFTAPGPPQGGAYPHPPGDALPETEYWPGDHSAHIQAAHVQETGLPVGWEHCLPQPCGLSLASSLRGGRDWPRARPSRTTCSPRGSWLAGIKGHASGKTGPVYSLRQSWLPRPARHQAQTTVAAGSSAWQLHCR